MTLPSGLEKPRLLLLGRPGCHLCEEFESELLEHFGPQRFELEQADVDSRADWRDQFGRRIPVLLDGQGRLICEARFDAAAFKNVLDA